MFWILLEALIALVVGIGIVWWTMGARKKTPEVTDDATKRHDK